MDGNDNRGELKKVGTKYLQALRLTGSRDSMLNTYPYLCAPGIKCVSFYFI